MEVNVHQAKTHLSRLLRRMEAGEDVVISRAGKPLARLTPLHRPRGKRKLGSAKGLIEVADDFNNPLPREVLESFES